MDDFELRPTEDNIFKTLTTDVLERKGDIVYFGRILNFLRGGRAIALDGQWGCGKTFFVKQVKMVLDAYNDQSNLDDEKRESIKGSFKDHIETKYSEFQPMMTLYYDAWENDSDIDPLISLIYSIAVEINQYSFFDKSKPGSREMIVSELLIPIIELAAEVLAPTVSIPFIKASKSAIKLGKKFFNVKKNITKIFKKENILDNSKTKKDLHKKINEFFDQIFQEQGLHLIIFVDELDRCRPDFAVKLLERVKHYFDNENVTFVFSINATELVETIKQFYGANFDGGRYLNRFFDFCIPLPKGNIQQFLDSIQLNKNTYTQDALLATIRGENLELREILRALLTFRLVENNLDNVYKKMTPDDHNSFEFCFRLLVPILIGIAVKNMKEYHDFIDGKRFDIFYSIVSQIHEPRASCQILLREDESFEKEDLEKNNVDFRDRIEKFYQALFSPDNRNRSMIIGKCAISARIRSKIREVASLLSYFTNFQENK